MTRMSSETPSIRFRCQLVLVCKRGPLPRYYVHISALASIGVIVRSCTDANTHQVMQNKCIAKCYHSLSSSTTQRSLADRWFDSSEWGQRSALFSKSTIITSNSLSSLRKTHVGRDKDQNCEPTLEQIPGFDSCVDVVRRIKPTQSFNTSLNNCQFLKHASTNIIIDA